MKRITSFSLGDEHLECLAAIREQTGWGNSKIIQRLLEQARVEGKVSLQVQWPAAVMEEAAHV